MAYKTIVVHLDASARRAERLELACRLAADGDAHLVGLFALPEPILRSPMLVDGAALIVQQYKSWRADQSARARQEFESSAKRRGVAQFEWRESAFDSSRALQVSARYADLLVIGQRDPDELPAYWPGEIVLAAGRPVLVVPYVGRFERLGERVLIAWNASREAARAVSDALPILQRARSVEVVAFDVQGSAHGPQPGADIALYLARQGVKPTAAVQNAGIDVGAQILSRAADCGADLIVMGAYGHSRARELVLGGATRTLLESMTVPVLMSH
jgi:nucleotide-binding universal stress UspA family protein